MISSELQAEWHPTLNLPLVFNLSLPAKKKYWWLGACGHQWETSLSNRKSGSGCLYCAGKKVLQGFNDFASQNPVLLAQWHPTKNTYSPYEITPKTKKLVWWICAEGHEWESRVLSRSNGAGCPMCAGNKILAGYNDLASLEPDIASEWHPTRNGTLTSSMVGKGTGKKVWWQCQLGHEWETTIGDRVNKGIGCHYCSGWVITIGVNDLFTLHPHLKNEFHPVKNSTEIDISLERINSSRKVWWLGPCGHEWEAPIGSRTQGHGCNYCGGNKVLAGFNDLATVFPLLAAEWHSTKNNLTPKEVNAKSGKKFWWLGVCGHEWEAQLSNRYNGAGCGVCAGKTILKGFNDLASQSLALAAEWHPTKNGDVSPDSITLTTSKKFWWQCQLGHEWQSTPNTRSKGAGCPFCSGNKVFPGFNDLFTVNPLVASEWHPTKNGDLTPKDFTFGAKTKVWWICTKKKHEWEALITDRTRYGCPYCAHLVSKAEVQIKEFLESLSLVVETSNRTILNGKELDLWIPAHNVGIEFNGIYWHREKRRGKDLHHNKYLAAQKAGIQLIQIWEDDWNQKPDLVKRMLAQKLGVAENLLAEETDVITVTKQQAEEFLNENHLQGYEEGSHYLGLVNKRDIETLRAVMVLDEEPETDGKMLNILRYATSANVIVGFAKLMSFTAETFSPDSFVAVADHCVFDSGLYEGNGFIVEKVIPPDYMYVVKNERKHRSEYPLERFHSDPKLLWEEGLTEMELADLNGLDRIWDAGKTLYRLSFVQ